MAKTSSKSSYVCIQEPDGKLLCSLCGGVARDPVQDSNCGKLFCAKCVKKHEDKESCPNCGTSPRYFRDIKSHEEIKRIPVKCKKAENGCSWTGTVATLEDHVTKSCDFTKVPCKYKSVGCTKKVIRKEVKTHEKKRAYIHLDLIYSHIRKMEEHLTVLKTMKNNSITFRLDEYELKKEQNRTHIEMFYTSPGGYQMDLLVGYNGVEEGHGTHISVATSILKTPAYSDFLKGSIKIEILNQLRDGNHFTKTLGLCYVDEVDAQIGTDFKFIKHLSLAYNEPTHTQYLANDKLYVRVTVVVDNHRPWLEYV